MAGTLEERRVESRAVWSALDRLSLYGMSDTALRALMARHHDDDPVVVAAARYAIGLRRLLAAGGTC
jgi:hypothetical protein